MSLTSSPLGRNRNRDRNRSTSSVLRNTAHTVRSIHTTGAVTCMLGKPLFSVIPHHLSSSTKYSVCPSHLLSPVFCTENRQRCVSNLQTKSAGSSFFSSCSFFFPSLARILGSLVDERGVHLEKKKDWTSFLLLSVGSRAGPLFDASE